MKVPVKVPYPVKVKTPYIVKVPYVVKIPIYHKEKYPVPIPVPEKVSYTMKEPIVEHGGYEHGSSYGGHSYGGSSSSSSYGHGGGGGGHGLYSDHGSSGSTYGNDHADHGDSEKHIVLAGAGSPHGYEYRQQSHHTLSYDAGKGGHQEEGDAYGGQQAAGGSKYASLPEYDTASYAVVGGGNGGGGADKYKYSTLSMGEESDAYDVGGQGYVQPSRSLGHYETTRYETKAY